VSKVSYVITDVFDKYGRVLLSFLGQFFRLWEYLAPEKCPRGVYSGLTYKYLFWLARLASEKHSSLL